MRLKLTSSFDRIPYLESNLTQKLIRISPFQNSRSKPFSPKLSCFCLQKLYLSPLWSEYVSVLKILHTKFSPTCRTYFHSDNKQRKTSPTLIFLQPVLLLLDWNWRKICGSVEVLFIENLKKFFRFWKRNQTSGRNECNLCPGSDQSTGVPERQKSKWHRYGVPNFCSNFTHDFVSATLGDLIPDSKWLKFHDLFWLEKAFQLDFRLNASILFWDPVLTHLSLVVTARPSGWADSRP